MRHSPPFIISSSFPLPPISPREPGSVVCCIVEFGTDEGGTPVPGGWSLLVGTGAVSDICRSTLLDDWLLSLSDFAGGSSFREDKFPSEARLVSLIMKSLDGVRPWLCLPGVGKGFANEAWLVSIPPKINGSKHQHFLLLERQSNNYNIGNKKNNHK